MRSEQCLLSGGYWCEQGRLPQDSGIRERAKEDKAVWLCFLRRLKELGLEGVLQFIKLANGLLIKH